MALAAKGSTQFETTLWSQVILAGKEPDSSAGREALQRLCAAYWFPAYAFVRRSGVRMEEAEDLTQGFFLHILNSNFFSRADPNSGRFRSFLLGALRHYLAHEREKNLSQRRGGREVMVPVDAGVGEDWLRSEPTPDNDSTRAFDRTWATALIGRAIAELQQEQDAARGAPFATLKEFFTREPEKGEYETLARRFGLSKAAIAAQVHRLKLRFRELVRREVRETVASPEMAAQELLFLLQILRG